MSNRLNLTLPPELWEHLRRRAQQQRVQPPEMARRLLAEGIRKLDGSDMERELRRAYRLLDRDDAALRRDFRSADLEGWE